MRLRIRDLHKRFGSLEVLRGLSIDVEPGEIVTLLGGSGTGKSVTLKLILGLIRPDAGTIEIDGIDITRLRERDLDVFRRRFGVVFQGGGMLQSLSVGENVGLGLLETSKEPPARVSEIVAEKLALVNLAGRERQSPGTLSGGQRKRAAIARALTMHADCFLLDEPTAGLDPPMSEDVDDIVEEVNRTTRASCILVTHDLISAFRLSKRIYLLKEGRVAATGTPEEFRRSDAPAVREFLSRELRSHRMGE